MQNIIWVQRLQYTILAATEDTETVVTVRNYRLFEELDERDRKASELAKQYSFSSNKPITVDWVMEHPKNAVEIMRLISKGGERFTHWRDYAASTYKK